MFGKSKAFCPGFCILICLLIISCATSAPQQTFLDRAGLAGMRNVAVTVSANPLDVSYSQNQQGITSAVLFGLLGAAIESGIRQGEDKETAEKVSQQLQLTLIEENMATSFLKELNRVPRFQKAEYVKERNADRSQLLSANYDSIIRLTVDKISLNKAPDPDDNLFLQIQVRGQVETLVSGKTLWDREVHLMGSQLHSLDFYKKHGLTELNGLLERASKKLATDFIYLK